MASNTKEVRADLSPYMIVYTDGSVKNLVESPFFPPSEDPATGVTSKDVTISPEVSARLYLPKLKTPDQKLPILVFFHGGGFLIGSAFEQLVHRYVNILAAESNALIVSVEYRLAPQHLLPAAYEDSWAALKWVASHLDENSGIEKDPWITNHGDFSRLYLGGESAGGNIAHNLTMRAGTEKLPGDAKILGSIISHPHFWGSKPISTMTPEENREHLTYKVWDIVYPSAPGGADCPLVNPVAENAPSLAGLACSKLFVCTAGNDVLRERILEYAEAVKKSGWKGEIEVVDVEGEGHCFQAFNPFTEKAKVLIKQQADFINK